MVGVLGSASSSPVSAVFGAPASSSRLPPVLAVLGDRRARSCPSWIPERRIQIEIVKLLMLKPGGAAVFEQGGGSPEFEVRRLPVRKGPSFDPRFEEDAAAARHRHVLFLAGDIVLQKDLCVISIFVGCLSVLTRL